MANIVESIKRAAIEANEANKPMAVIFGTVENSDPIKIKIEQKISLGAAQLILLRNVTDYVVEMTVNHATEAYNHSHSCGGEGCGISEDEHSHDYRGKKSFIVHNKLRAGEKVLLLREQGGQRFVVWDRVEV